MKYYISDLQLGHTGIIKSCGRPFGSVEEMDKCLIDAWNCRITDRDDVFIVGDFIYKSSESFSYYLKQLRGHKYLILGDHDEELLKDPDARDMLDNVMPYLELQDADNRIILYHYPLTEWPGYYKGWKHFYGHIHNNPSHAADFIRESENAFNICADVIGPMPLTAEEIINGRTNEWWVE